MTCHFAQVPVQGASLRQTHFHKGLFATKALGCSRPQNMSKSCAEVRDVKDGPCLCNVNGVDTQGCRGASLVVMFCSADSRRRKAGLMRGRNACQPCSQDEVSTGEGTQHIG